MEDLLPEADVGRHDGDARNSWLERGGRSAVLVGNDFDMS
jgi:hypothetical protein